MKVVVERVVIPVGSSTGIAFGSTDDGTVLVIVASDWRAMMDLGEALVAAREPIVAEFEDWQVLGSWEVVPETPEE